MLSHERLMKHDFDGLVQNLSNSSALAMELLQSCTKPSFYWFVLALFANWIFGGFFARLVSITGFHWRSELTMGTCIRQSTLVPRVSENIFRPQCKRGSSKWASPHHEQFATFLRNFYIFKQFLGNLEIWASVRRTRRTLFSDALLVPDSDCDRSA